MPKFQSYVSKELFGLINTLLPHGLVLFHRGNIRRWALRCIVETLGDRMSDDLLFSGHVVRIIKSIYRNKCGRNALNPVFYTVSKVKISGTMVIGVKPS